MRRSILPAALLSISVLACACAHPTSEGAGASSPTNSPVAAVPDEVAASAELDASAAPERARASDDPNVISFEEEAGPTDMVIAPPKREEIPGFELFGTGPRESEPGPQLTLPPDME